MKIAVFSDSHGCVQNMIDAVEAISPDMIVHLGDCTRDADALSEEFPLIPLVGVKGNCDVDYTSPEDRTFEVEGVRFFIAHGHRQNVKIDILPFLNSIYFSGSQIGLFGHTHHPVIREIEGTTIMNPGTCKSCMRPTFGVVVVKNGEFKCKLLEISAALKLNPPTLEDLL